MFGVITSVNTAVAWIALSSGIAITGLERIDTSAIAPENRDKNVLLGVLKPKARRIRATSPSSIEIIMALVSAVVAPLIVTVADELETLSCMVIREESSKRPFTGSSNVSSS